MKKLLVFILLIINISLTGHAKTNNLDDPHGGGFRLNFHFGLPGSLYGADELADKEYWKKIKPSLTMGLELGHKFTFTKFADDKLSFGMMVDWIDFNFGRTVEFNAAAAFVNVGFLEFGPSFTYALNDKIGFDAYYQLKPTVFSRVFAVAQRARTTASVGTGFSHAVGIGFRYSLFSVALEPNFGSIQITNTDADNLVTRANTTNFRILLGFKF
jgi:hypothetical protein